MVSAHPEAPAPLTPAEAAAAAMRAAVFGPVQVDDRAGSGPNEAEEAVAVARAEEDPEPPRSPAVTPAATVTASAKTGREGRTGASSSDELSDFIEASGLLDYDPAAITRIYAGHPQRLLRRLWQTLVPIGLFLLSVGLDWLSRRLRDPDHARARAKEAADLVASLGPAFIKAGQALSTRPDIVPPLLLEELAQLQDQLPGFESALAMACIEEDLGAPIHSIYAELEREPISAASLGQVHRGV
ncbi:MAG: hypothetical protein RLZZ124_1665, partial [Cyanobacteriota bacterium]